MDSIRNLHISEFILLIIIVVKGNIPFAKIVYICEQKAKDMKKRIILITILTAVIATISSCAGDIGKLSTDIDYLAYAITESNHPALEEGVYAYMVRNKEKDCYYFRKTGDNPVSLEYICKGTYKVDAKVVFNDELLSEAVATPFITLSYPSDEDERFADQAAPQRSYNLMFEVDHKDTKLDEVLSRFNFYLGINWDALIQKALDNYKPVKTKVLAHPTLRTHVENTDYFITGEIATSPEMPSIE